MEVQQIREGLWRWTVPHPAWKPEQGGPAGWDRDVGCLYLETESGVVLFDPLAPPEGTEEADRFWNALDRDVARIGSHVTILMGNRDHMRSVQAVHDRYARDPGCSIRAHAALMRDLGEPGGPQEPVLPAGIEAHPIEGLDVTERAYYMPAHEALVIADALIGTGAGGVRLAPPSWAVGGPEGAERYRTRFRESLRELLTLPVEMLLVSHGPLVLSGGEDALRAALDA